MEDLWFSFLDAGACREGELGAFDFQTFIGISRIIQDPCQTTGTDNN